MISKVAVKRMGATYLNALLQLLPATFSLLHCITDLEAAKEVGHQALNAGWDVEELKGKGDELVGDRIIGILQIQTDNMEVSLFPPGCMNLVPGHG